MMKNRLSMLALSLLVFGVSASSAKAQTPVDTETRQAAERRLSEAQLQSIKAIHNKAAKHAALLAVRLALTTKRVYENMLREREDAALRSRLSAEMHRLAGELLTIKGQSIREVLHVLTSEQKRLIKSEMKKPDAPADLMEVIVRTFNIPEK